MFITPLFTIARIYVHQQMDGKEEVVYIYNIQCIYTHIQWVVYIYNTQPNNAICSNMDATRDCHIK